MDSELKLWDAAFSLRKSTLNAKHEPLPDNLTLQHVLKGEIKIPEDLTSFLSHLITGPDTRNGIIDAKMIRIRSIAQYLIYAATGGHVKPSKHLVLGFALKKLTSIRKVADILLLGAHDKLSLARRT